MQNNSWGRQAGFRISKGFMSKPITAKLFQTTHPPLTFQRVRKNRSLRGTGWEACRVEGESGENWGNEVSPPALSSTTSTWRSRCLSTELTIAGPRVAVPQPLPSKAEPVQPTSGAFATRTTRGSIRVMGKPPGSLPLAGKETLSFSSPLTPLSLILVPSILGFRG